MTPFHKVLCPLDLGPNTELCLDFAAKLADQETKLVLFYVIPLPIEAIGQPIFIEPQRGGEHDAREQLKRLADEASLTAEIAVAIGDPATEIMRAARDHQCDLIAMATHGRTGLGHFFLGSVAERVVRESPVAVLTLRTASH